MMRFGAVLPITELGSDAGAIRDLATGIEALDFDHLIAYDHVLGAVHDGREHPLSGPYDEHDEFHEVFVLFGHLAAVTSRIELATGVLIAPQRQTALIAKQAAEVHLLSGGRLRLGLGTGWNWVEYESLGTDFDTRGARLDDQVEVLTRLWSEPIVTVDTSFHHIDRAGIAPRPDRPIPLWFGGYSPPAFRRSARHGSGHLFGHLDERALAGAARLLELRDEIDFAEAFGLEAITDVTTAPDTWVEAARTWHAAGGTHLSARTMRTAGAPDRGFRSVDDHLAAFERWRDALRAEGLWT